MEKNTFENVVYEMLSISSRPQCVKSHSSADYALAFRALYESRYKRLVKPYAGELGPQSYEPWQMADYYMVCLWGLP